jgi:hypothetical protein
MANSFIVIALAFLPRGVPLFSSISVVIRQEKNLAERNGVHTLVGGKHEG